MGVGTMKLDALLWRFLEIIGSKQKNRRIFIIVCITLCWGFTLLVYLKDRGNNQYLTLILMACISALETITGAIHWRKRRHKKTNDTPFC